MGKFGIATYRLAVMKKIKAGKVTDLVFVPIKTKTANSSRIRSFAKVKIGQIEIKNAATGRGGVHGQGAKAKCNPEILPIKMAKAKEIIPKISIGQIQTKNCESILQRPKFEPIIVAEASEVDVVTDTNVEKAESSGTKAIKVFPKVNIGKIEIKDCEYILQRPKFKPVAIVESVEHDVVAETIVEAKAERPVFPKVSIGQIEIKNCEFILQRPKFEIIPEKTPVIVSRKVAETIQKLKVKKDRKLYSKVKIGEIHVKNIPLRQGVQIQKDNFAKVFTSDAVQEESVIEPEQSTDDIEVISSVAKEKIVAKSELVKTKVLMESKEKAESILSVEIVAENVPVLEAEAREVIIESEIITEAIVEGGSNEVIDQSASSIIAEIEAVEAVTTLSPKEKEEIEIISEISQEQLIDQVIPSEVIIPQQDNPRKTFEKSENERPFEFFYLEGSNSTQTKIASTLAWICIILIL